MCIRDSTTGVPTKVSFQSLVSTSDAESISNTETAYFDRLPESAFVMRLYHYEPLLLKNATSGATEGWVLGDSGDGSHLLNIPEEWVHEVIWKGARAYLETAVERTSKRDSWQQFQEWVALVAGRTSLYDQGDLQSDDRIE